MLSASGFVLGLSIIRETRKQGEKELAFLSFVFFISVASKVAIGSNFQLLALLDHDSSCSLSGTSHRLLISPPQRSECNVQVSQACRIPTASLLLNPTCEAASGNYYFGLT